MTTEPSDPIGQPAEPWFARHDDGRIEGHWPDGVDQVMCSREVLDGMVTEHNRLVAEVARLTTTVDRAYQ
jgi:hypothetical protein